MTKLSCDFAFPIHNKLHKPQQPWGQVVRVPVLSEG